jgi:hypothetical protein
MWHCQHFTPADRLFAAGYVVSTNDASWLLTVAWTDEARPAHSSIHRLDHEARARGNALLRKGHVCRGACLDWFQVDG